MELVSADAGEDEGRGPWASLGRSEDLRMESREASRKRDPQTQVGSATD